MAQRDMPMSSSSIERQRPVERGARWSSPRQLVAALASLCAAQLAYGAECTVPGDRPTIAAAVADAACDPIRLAAQGYFESPRVARSLSLLGAGQGSTTIWGRLQVEGAGVLVEVHGLTVYSGCSGPALAAGAGATLRSSDLLAAKSATAQCNAVTTLFADGFE